MLLNVLNVNIHCGKTTMPACLRFFRGSISAKNYSVTEIYINHDIKRMYGVSFGDGVFIGILVCDKRKESRSAVESEKVF